MKKMQLKTPGLILPSFYLLQSNTPDSLTGASQQQLPQNQIAKYPGDHLRFVGLFDVDMPTGSAKLDPSKVNSFHCQSDQQGFRRANQAGRAVLCADTWDAGLVHGRQRSAHSKILV
jgi:hypothetical protein